MIIKSIKMKNFRQYKDTMVTFSTDHKKNVTIIMGDNGAGKTTLAQAFQWVLYNNTSFKKNLFNVHTFDEMMESETQRMSVILDIIYDGKDYTIKRSISYTKIGSGETARKKEGQGDFTISQVVNGDTKYLPDYRKEYLIKQILPKDLSHLFFFDGETMDEMANQIDEGQVDTYKKTVEALVGLKAMQNAIKHLDNRIERKTNSIKSTVVGRYDAEISKIAASQDESRHLSNLVSQLKEKIHKNEELQGQQQDALNRIEKEIEVNRRIVESVTSELELKNKYKQLQSKIGKEREDKKMAMKSLIGSFNTQAYAFFSLPLALEVEKDVVDKEVPQLIPQLTKKTIESILTNKQCICGRTFEECDDVYEKIHSLLAFAYPKTINQQITEYHTTMQMTDEQGRKYWDRFINDYRHIQDIDEQIRGHQIESDEIYHQMGNTEEGERAKKNLDRLRREKGITNDSITTLKALIMKDREDLGYKENEQKKYMNTDSNARHFYLYREYALRISQLLSENYRKKETQTREKLEQKINTLFEAIYDGNIKIHVDDHYNIIVDSVDNMFSGNEIEKNTAQKYAIIFAFITAVIELAKENAKEDLTRRIQQGDENTKEEIEGYPLVMDAPLSAFDKTRIKKICDEIPQIADQVIMFIKDTDGEIAEQYLSEKIGKRYEIEKVNGSNLYSDIVTREVQ